VAFAGFVAALNEENAAVGVEDDAANAEQRVVGVFALGQGGCSGQGMSCMASSMA
jgi:hypothetical protein